MSCRWENNSSIQKRLKVKYQICQLNCERLYLMGHRRYVIFVLLFPIVELVTLGYTTHSKVNKIDGDASRLVKQGIIYNGVNLKIPRSYTSKYNRYYGLSRNQMVFFTSVNRSYLLAKKYSILKRVQFDSKTK